MSYKGRFRPTNKQKYRGDSGNIVYRSLWELKFFRIMDTHPDARPGSLNGMYGRDRSGPLNPMFGTHHSEETRRKIAQKAIGRKPSEIAKKNMSIAQLKAWTPERRQKKKEECKDRPWGDYYSARNTKWYTNGEISIRSKENPGEGWILGRGKLPRKK